MDWDKAAATQHFQCLKVASHLFHTLVFTTFTLSVGCGCGTFEWLLRVSSCYTSANELEWPCQPISEQKTLPRESTMLV